MATLLALGLTSLVSVPAHAAPPAPPQITQPASGTVVSERPVIGGTSVPDAFITVYEGSAIVATTTADAAGAWSVRSSGALASGAHTLTATASDGVEVSVASSGLTFTVDAALPDPLIVTSPVPGGVYASAGLQFMKGYAEPGATVEITVDGAPYGTVTAGSSGLWVANVVSLTEGSHTMVFASPGSGAPTSISVTFALDTTPPVSPTLTSPVAGLYNYSSHQIAFTVDTDSDVESSIVIDGAPGTALPPSPSTRSFVDGTHTIFIVSRDSAGNSVSTSVTFTVDTTPPAAPQVTTPGALTNDSTPTIGGTSEASATMSVALDGGLATTVSSNGAGAWSLPALGSALSQGTHTIVATATDAAGNTSAATTHDFVVDTIPPAAPVLDAVPSVVGAAATFTGTAEPAAQVTVTAAGSATSTVAGSDGGWSASFSGLTTGLHDVSAVATDAAGNDSVPSALQPFTVDATPPSVPTVTSPLSGAVVGSSATLSGVAEAGSTVRLAVPALATTAGLDGTWSVTVSGLVDGPLSFSVTATDALGNVSPASVLAVQVDATAPAAPVIAAPQPGTIVPPGVTVISGSAEPGSTVRVALDGAQIGVVQADAGGGWSVSTTLTDGAYIVEVSAVDAVGNESAVTRADLRVAVPTPELAETGGELAPSPLGALAIGCGGLLLFIAARRRAVRTHG